MRKMKKINFCPMAIRSLVSFRFMVLSKGSLSAHIHVSSKPICHIIVFSPSKRLYDKIHSGDRQTFFGKRIGSSSSVSRKEFESSA